MKDSMAIVIEHLVAVVAGASTTLASGISAADTSISLADGSAFQSTGHFAVMLESEAAIVTRSGNTLTTISRGRGRFGTTAAVHSMGATVSMATLYDLVGSRVSTNPPPDNDSPYIWIENQGERVAGLSESLDVPAQLRCFGGNKKEASDLESNLIYRLLFERLHGAAVQSTASGAVVNAFQVNGGQRGLDPDASWIFTPARYRIAAR